ncbi:hypothetical protein AKJ16_DCAP19894 [Drosera capensis]
MAPYQDMGKLDCSADSEIKQSPNVESRSKLKQEIMGLEKRLQGQIAGRRALEKALKSGFVSIGEASLPKSATELIKEIAVLEMEVVYLEHYLLSLYRKTFDQQVLPVSPTVKEQKPKSSVMIHRQLFVDDAAVNSSSKIESAAISSGPRSLSNNWTERRGTNVEDRILASGVHRCHSSLSQRSTLVTSNSMMDSLSRAVPSCHSQPLSMMEYVDELVCIPFYLKRVCSEWHMIILAEHLNTHIPDYAPETPNTISEAMVKCMAAIFCKFAEPPSSHNGLSSLNSWSSSMAGFSPQHPSSVWSPVFGRDLSHDTCLDNPFNVEGLEEFSGPYSTMVEVPCIYKERQQLGDVEQMLQNFKLLIRRLQDIDHKEMKHEEKLAFWINIHNALVMHALLAYAIPQNSVKRLFLLLKAAYNVGDHVLSADTIQSAILGCRIAHPGQLKTADERKAYALEHPEPLLHFALCSGSHSDPALRAYTPKRVSLELEAAKEEYIRAAFGMSKDRKIVLPKLVESYVKDAGLCTGGLIEKIHQSLPQEMSARKITQEHQVDAS